MSNRIGWPVYARHGSAEKMGPLLLDPLRNRLLAALPQPDFILIARHVATSSMPVGRVLNEADAPLMRCTFQ